MKTTSAVNEFKKSRSIEYESLVQKFKNRFKYLEKLQTSELSIILRKSKLNYIN
jgi:hypothetical protein